MKFRKAITILSIVATFAIWGSFSLHAQTPKAEVRAIIDQLFNSMRTSDSTLLRKTFLPDARLRSISINKEGKAVAENSPIEGFVKAVGTTHKDIWDERIYDVEIRVDGPVATAWTPYKFYFGETFSHCGVNTFTLIKTNEGWRIAGITDTRRREDCP